MTDERIIKINKIGKASKIIARVILICTIIASIATTALSIACFCVPSDVATVSLNGSAEITVTEKYLDIAKRIFSEVNEGMTEEGQMLEIAGTEYEYASADIEGDTININYKSLNNDIGVRDFGTFLLSGALVSISTMVLLIFVVALCKAIEKSNSPFEESIIDKMKKLAIAIIPWAVINAVASGLSGFAFTGKFDIEQGLDLGVLLIVLVFVVLISIFRYGAVLQQQSDETL